MKEKAAELKTLIAKYIADNNGLVFGPCPWTLRTELGHLLVSLHEGYTDIFWKFEDVDRAVAGLGRFKMNPYSGKWNHHLPNSWSAQQMFDYWTLQVKSLTAGG